MIFHHRLLDVMQFAAMFQIFHGDQLFSMDRRHKRQAGVDRAVVERIALRFSQHYRARAAITGCTTFLGAAATGVLPQVLQYRGIGRKTVFGVDPAVH